MQYNIKARSATDEQREKRRGEEKVGALRGFVKIVGLVRIVVLEAGGPHGTNVPYAPFRTHHISLAYPKYAAKMQCVRTSTSDPSIPCGPPLHPASI